MRQYVVHFRFRFSSVSEEIIVNSFLQNKGTDFFDNHNTHKNTQTSFPKIPNFERFPTSFPPSGQIWSDYSRGRDFIFIVPVNTRKGVTTVLSLNSLENNLERKFSYLVPNCKEKIKAFLVLVNYSDQNNGQYFLLIKTGWIATSSHSFGQNLPSLFNNVWRLTQRNRTISMTISYVFK